MRKPLIAGNWKMHKSLAEAHALASAVRDGHTPAEAVDVLLCPPYVWLLPVVEAVKGSPVMVGAQNVHEEAKGAFTGEVAVGMLSEAGCSHVIIGHSERRHVFGEKGDQLAKKVAAALAGGLKVVYCIGELLAEREADRTEAVVTQQLNDVKAAIGDALDPAQVVFAYEPVWAIGTGKVATPEQAQDVHKFVRGWLAENYGQEAAMAARILYGGSVKPGNAAGLLEKPDVDGALVGGACLVAEDFLAIIAAAQQVAA